MIRRILIPLDGSEMAEGTIMRLEFLLDQSDARVTLLQVLDWRQKGWLTQAAVQNSALEDELVEEATAYLDGMAGKLRKTGNDVRTKIERGSAAEVIISVASEEESSVVCMATHGRTGLDHLLYGSITEKVVRACERPVLVVPSFDRTEPEGGVDRREWSFESILVALDGSRQAMQIIPHVAEGVRLFGSRVTLALVLDKSVGEATETRAAEHLEGAKELFADAKVKAESVILRGHPATELLDYAPRHGHDMIMMTTHGRSGVSKWMLGSVAEKVVRRATVPVFVVRTTESES
jgi:nucleotide-binding universal stress UspA family protein